jgi:hypothetical protein
VENAQHVQYQENQRKLVHEKRTIDLPKNVEVDVAVVQQTESIPQIHGLFRRTEKILVLAETRQRSQNGQRFSKPKDGSIAIRLWAEAESRLLRFFHFANVST